MMQRNAEIFELSTQGKTAEEIAQDYQLTPQRINQILRQIELEAAIHLRDHVAELLSRQFARSETIIEKLADEAFDTKGKPNYPAIDRIEKHQKGQREIIAGAQHLIPPDDNSNKYDIDMSDSEYLNALEDIRNDPDVLLLEDGDE